MDTRHGASPTTAPAAAAVASNKPLVFSKMESLVREMQDSESGIPIRSQKLFLTSIPSAFMGYDLVEWLMDRLEIEDSAEAIHLANLLCQYGYFFPVGETRSLIVKDDSSLYRFQTPYYWPSQNHSADNTDYAIYLTKRQARNKQKHGLEDYELETYNKLKKTLQYKWDFILMQAEEQVRLAKDRKKGDKIVTDSQERAYWRVYRPPPGFNNCLENAPIPDRNNMANRVKKKTVESTKQEIELITKQIERTRIKVSLAAESLLSFVDTFFEYDPFLTAPQPSNPWITDDPTFWLLNESLVETPTEKRVRRWAISFTELVNDPMGLNEFTNYLRKEYCHENIRFWQAVLDLRYGPATEVNNKVSHIFDEFLKPGAPCEINIDGKTMEGTQQQMKTPSRYTYDLAAEHVYVLLLKKDCYPRFLRSDYYKNLLANAIQPLQKRRFFSFGGPGKKKAAAISSSNSVTLQAQTPQPLKRHGSDEHAAAASQGGGSVLPGGEGFGSQGSSLTPLQPRVDCDPPYSSTDVCPWDVGGSDTVCPWEGSSPPQKGPPPQPPPPNRLQQSLHHSLPPKAQHLSKPRPDRSKSVDVNVIGPQRQPPALPFAPTLGEQVRGPPCSEGGSKGEKAQSVDVCPWETPQPPTKKAANVPTTTLREVYHTTLAPTAGVSPPLSERRASEGVLRMALGPVCPIEDVLQISPKGRSKEGEIKISVPSSHRGDREEGSDATSPSDKPLDYTVRSGHLRGILGLGDEGPQKEKVTNPPLSLPKSALEQSIATSLAALTCAAPPQFTRVETPMHEYPPLNVQQSGGPHELLETSLSLQETPRRDESEGGRVIPEALEIQVPHGEEGGASPSNSPSASSTLEEAQPQRTADVCPWEDEESCKMDTPYVKRYTTFGYL